ncbi:hypothetical protein [Streptomyces tuirus]
MPTRSRGKRWAALLADPPWRQPASGLPVHGQSWQLPSGVLADAQSWQLLSGVLADAQSWQLLSGVLTDARSRGNR